MFRAIVAEALAGARWAKLDSLYRGEFSVVPHAPMSRFWLSIPLLIVLGFGGYVIGLRTEPPEVPPLAPAEHGTIASGGWAARSADLTISGPTKCRKNAFSFTDCMVQVTNKSDTRVDVIGITCVFFGSDGLPIGEAPGSLNQLQPKQSVWTEVELTDSGAAPVRGSCRANVAYNMPK